MYSKATTSHDLDDVPLLIHPRIALAFVDAVSHFSLLPVPQDLVQTHCCPEACLPSSTDACRFVTHNSALILVKLHLIHIHPLFQCVLIVLDSISYLPGYFVTPSNLQIAIYRLWHPPQSYLSMAIDHESPVKLLPHSGKQAAAILTLVASFLETSGCCYKQNGKLW